MISAWGRPASVTWKSVAFAIAPDIQASVVVVSGPFSTQYRAARPEDSGGLRDSQDSSAFKWDALYLVR